MRKSFCRTPNKEMSVLLVMFEALQFDDEMRETFFTKVQNTILQSEKAEIPQLSKELIGEVSELFFSSRSL